MLSDAFPMPGPSRYVNLHLIWGVIRKAFRCFRCLSDEIPWWFPTNTYETRSGHVASLSICSARIATEFHHTWPSPGPNFRVLVLFLYISYKLETCGAFFWRKMALVRLHRKYGDEITLPFSSGCDAHWGTWPGTLRRPRASCPGTSLEQCVLIACNLYAYVYIYIYCHSYTILGVHVCTCIYIYITLAHGSEQHDLIDPRYFASSHASGVWST